MFVLVVGGGRTGTQLASLLLNQNHEVHVVEHRSEILPRLHHDLPTEIIFEGSFSDLEVLEMAGITQADVLAACTANDAENLAVCYIGRTRYNVTRTIARINNPRNAWLFDDTFHVDVSLNNAEIMARLIEEEMSMGDMITLLKLRRGEYSLVEEKIAEGARGIGIAIKDLALPENCVIAAIIRNGKVVLPRGITEFETGDEVLAITDPKGADQLSALLSTPDIETPIRKPSRK